MGDKGQVRDPKFLLRSFDVILQLFFTIPSNFLVSAYARSIALFNFQLKGAICFI